MNNTIEKIFKIIIKALTALSLLMLLFVIYYIIKNHYHCLTQ